MTFNGTLLPYQPEAVDKMVAKKRLLVAYDLGLGKTVLTIAAIERMMEQGDIREPGLVICLSSLKYQWKDSIEKFSDSKALVIDGNISAREKQYKEALNWEETGVDYIITNYELAWRDVNHMRYLPRGFIVLDEATAIKSFRSRRSKAVKSLKAPVRFALTGTPIENGKPEELFSIMQFVDAGILGDFRVFDNAFIVRNAWGRVERYRNLSMLHEKMKEASVRKSQRDPDVAPFLPQVTYTDPIKVFFDGKTAKLYNHMVDDLLDKLSALSTSGAVLNQFDVDQHYGGNALWAPGNSERGEIMSIITCLRMLCDNPELLRRSALKADDPLTPEGSKYAASLLAEGRLDGVVKTPKLDALMTYLTDILEADDRNKVVIFSSFVDNLEFIGSKLTVPYVVFSGQMDSKQRNDAKNEFNNNSECRVLISSDAGGYGVDLPSANVLINYDLPWAAGLAVQRNGRIQRASSEWSTIVIQDMIIRDSIEQHQWDMLRKKRAVADAIIDGEKINAAGGIDITVDTLSRFLVNHSV